MPVPCFTPVPGGQLTNGRAWGHLHPQGKGLSQSLPRRPLLLSPSGGRLQQCPEPEGLQEVPRLGCCPGCPVPPAPKVTGGFTASTDHVVFSRVPAPVHLSPHSMAQRNWPPPGSPPGPSLSQGLCCFSSALPTQERPGGRSPGPSRGRVS